MGSLSAAAIAWTAIAVTIIISSGVYATLIWRGVIGKGHRPFQNRSKRLISAVIRNGRGSRLKRFESIATGVVSDVESALQPPLCNRHARSFLPILTDVRRRGQTLLKQQTGAHRVAAPDRERMLFELVSKLFVLETQLKSLPKPSVTIEEVLSGKFE